MKVFDVSSTDYVEDKRLINNALSDIAAQCGMQNDFTFGNPTSKFGWTFFRLWIKPNFQEQIELKFADMIKKSKGGKHDEKFTNFMSDYFQARGCKTKIKMTDA